MIVAFATTAVGQKVSSVMKTLERLMLVVLAGLALAACERLPNPIPSQPWVGADGRVVQPPPEGWPDYTKGAGSDHGFRH